MLTMIWVDSDINFCSSGMIQFSSNDDNDGDIDMEDNNWMQ